MRNFITHFQPMIPQEEPQYQRRIATSQVTTSISITLVLFLMGLFGLILFHARVLSDYVRENIGFSIMIREGVKEAGILQLKKALDGSGYVKSSEYVAKERAAEKLKAELGEDFVGFLGYNPLLPAIVPILMLLTLLTSLTSFTLSSTQTTFTPYFFSDNFSL